MAGYAYITDQTDFNRSQKHLRDLFDCDQRLPSQVFRASYGSFKAHSADFVVGSLFWEWVQNSPLNATAEQILVAMLDPDPDTHFKRHFGTYGMFRISGSASPADYWHAISEHPKEATANAFAFNSNILAIAPDSLAWGVWCDRNLNLSVIGFRDTADGRKVGDDHWQAIASKIQNGLTLEFRDGVVPADIADPLLRNYAN